MCFAAVAAAGAGNTFLGLSAATWSTIGSVVSTGFSVYNAYTQAQGQRDMAKYNEAVARNNATMAEYQAQDAVARGNKAAEDHSRKVASLAGTQRATMAARGLDISEGTPAEILTDTELFGQQDAATIKNNAAKEAWAARVQGSNYSAQAGMYSTQAENSSPLMAAGGSLLTGASSIAEKWYRSSKAG